MAQVAERSVRNASVTVLVGGPGGWRAERVDDVAHLAEEHSEVTEHPGQGDE
jgi:hypothetical protein